MNKKLYNSAGDIPFYNFVKGFNGDLEFLFTEKVKLNSKTIQEAEKKLNEMMFDVFPEYRKFLFNIIDLFIFDSEAVLLQDVRKINISNTNKKQFFDSIKDSKHEKLNINKIIFYIESTFNSFGSIDAKKISASYAFELLDNAIKTNKSKAKQLKNKKL